MGRGDGGFHEESYLYPSGEISFWVKFADVNGDSNLDLMVSDSFRDVVRVYQGRGDGSFIADSHYDGPLYVGRTLSDDFNGDGILDVLALDNENRVFFYPGRGDGMFDRAVNDELGNMGGTNVVWGDLDGDGVLDLVSRRDWVGDHGAMDIRFGDGEFGFTKHDEYVFVEHVHWYLSLFDMDGDLDICAGELSNDEGVVRAIVYMNDGQGNLGEHIDLVDNEVLTSTRSIFADINSDGLGDYLFYDQSLAELKVYLNKSGFKFEEMTFEMNELSSGRVEIHDVNQDGLNDIGIIRIGNPRLSSVVWVWIQQSDGTFVGPLVTDVESIANVHSLTFSKLEDVDGDGFVDMVLGKRNQFQVLSGDGSGYFGYQRVYLGEGFDNLRSMVASDFDGDGDFDLAFQDYDTRGLFVRMTACDYGFECVADLSGDGMLDYFDVSEFVIRFFGEDPSVDFDQNDQWDFFDVSVFLQVFANGCP